MVILQKVESSIRFLDKGLEITALVCLLISVIGAVISVFLRYVLDMSFQIIEEICRYAIIYGVFAYIGPLIKKGEHLKMDIMHDLFKGKVKNGVDICISIILFASFVFLFWSSIVWTTSLFNMEVMTASGIMLMVIPALSIPIGMFLGFVYSFLQMLHDVYTFRQHDKLEHISSVESKIGS